MAQISHHGRKLIGTRIDQHLEDIEAAPLHDAVAVADDGDEVLTEIAIAAERTWFAMKATYGAYDGDERREAESEMMAAYEIIVDRLEKRVDENVAEVGCNAIRNGDEWKEHRDEDAVDNSQHEAREWLQTHQEAAQRAGIWESVCSH